MLVKLMYLAQTEGSVLLQAKLTAIALKDTKDPLVMSVSLGTPLTTASASDHEQSRPIMG